MHGAEGRRDSIVEHFIRQRESGRVGDGKRVRGHDIGHSIGVDGVGKIGNWAQHIRHESYDRAEAVPKRHRVVGGGKIDFALYGGAGKKVDDIVGGCGNGFTLFRDQGSGIREYTVVRQTHSTREEPGDDDRTRVHNRRFVGYLNPVGLRSRGVNVAGVEYGARRSRNAICIVPTCRDRSRIDDVASRSGANAGCEIPQCTDRPGVDDIVLALSMNSKALHSARRDFARVGYSVFANCRNGIDT